MMKKKENRSSLCTNEGRNIDESVPHEKLSVAKGSESLMEGESVGSTRYVDDAGPEKTKRAYPLVVTKNLYANQGRRKTRALAGPWSHPKILHRCVGTRSS